MQPVGGDAEAAQVGGPVERFDLLQGHRNLDSIIAFGLLVQASSQTEHGTPTVLGGSRFSSVFAI